MQALLSILSFAIIFAAVILILQFALRSKIPKNIRRALGAGFILAGIVLMIFRIFGLAYFLIFTGLALALGRGMRSKRSSPERKSQVRSDHLEMRLDHDTGNMDGTILSGSFEGSMLSELGLDELFQVKSSLRDDVESVALLETYLDFAHSNWREYADAGTDEAQNGPPVSGGLSRNEAYRILGLKPGASENEIRDAYHRLIKRVHPDRGGTAALAAQINEARDRLLGDR